MPKVSFIRAMKDKIRRKSAESILHSSNRNPRGPLNRLKSVTRPQKGYTTYNLKAKILKGDDPMTTKSENGWNFDNSYARLPKIFFTRQNPEPVRAPEMVIFNNSLAAELG